MGIDLLDVKPNKISRDLRDYVWGIYGEPGIGKTTLAANFKDALIIAFEKGYLALPDIMAIDVTSWNDFKQVVRQLKDEKVKQKFKFIFVDTADIAWDECEKYICRREGVEKIGDIPWGGGYKETEKEFFNIFKTIINEGYGFGWISHSEFKSVKYEGYEEYQKVTTTLPKKAKKVLFGMSDVVIYGKMIRNEDGEIEERRAFVNPSGKYEAKKRFKYMPENFEFSYEALVNAFNEAIQKEEQAGSQTKEKLEKPRYESNEEEILDEIKKEIMSTAKQLKEQGVEVRDINDVLQGDPRKLQDADKAQEILVALKKLG